MGEVKNHLSFLNTLMRHGIKKPLLPEDPSQRAKARFWAKFADEKFESGIRTAFRTKGKEQEKAVKESLQLLNASSRGRDQREGILWRRELGFCGFGGGLDSSLAASSRRSKWI
ncbi:hypothetical protein AAC387_Pa02g4586 [Persea americana]